MPGNRRQTHTPAPRAVTCSTLFLAALLTGLSGSCGCDHPVAKALHPANVAHELRRHRLWRMNQNRPLSENVYFSVPPRSHTSTAPSTAPSTGDQLGGSPGQQLVGRRHAE